MQFFFNKFGVKKIFLNGEVTADLNFIKKLPVQKFFK